MQAIKFEDMPGWEIDNHLAALQTFSRQRLKPDGEILPAASAASGVRE